MRLYLLIGQLGFQLSNIDLALLGLGLLDSNLLALNKIETEHKIFLLSGLVTLTACSSVATASFSPSTVLNTTNANPLGNIEDQDINFITFDCLPRSASSWISLQVDVVDLSESLEVGRNIVLFGVLKISWRCILKSRNRN